MRQAAGVQSPFEIVACETAQVAVSRSGSGTPVLCLHATGHGGRDFSAFADRAVPQGFEVVTVDWPGQGSSPPAPASFTASAVSYADLAGQLIAKLWPDGQHPIVIGNSIGGAAAIRLAAHRPDLVRALVLCNPGGLAPLGWLGRAYIGHMVRFFTRGANGSASYPAAFARYYRRILPSDAAAAQRGRIVAGGRETAAMMAQAWESFRSPAADIRSLVAAITCPVLYAWAKDDRIVSWRASKAAALTATDHRLALFPGGHSAFLEAPDEFFATFAAFAGSIGD